MIRTPCVDNTPVHLSHWYMTLAIGCETGARAHQARLQTADSGSVKYRVAIKPV